MRARLRSASSHRKHATTLDAKTRDRINSVFAAASATPDDRPGTFSLSAAKVKPAWMQNSHENALEEMGTGRRQKARKEGAEARKQSVLHVVDPFRGSPAQPGSRRRASFLPELHGAQEGGGGRRRASFLHDPAEPGARAGVA